MNYNYVITNEELTNIGLDLNEYSLDTTFIPAIINIALDIAITRCCFLNDSFNGETSIESALDNDVANDNEKGLVASFKKLQRRIIWNLIFTGTDDPVDLYVDTIITHELKWGKINGFQKGLYYKNN